MSPVKEYAGYAVLSSDRKPIGVVSNNSERRAHCDPKRLPTSWTRLLIAIEDHRFLQHGAVDAKAILRATLRNLGAFKVIQGGSTITQQLARNIMRDNRRTLHRKIKEARLAFRLERKHSKEEIIGLYFNTVFWGKQIYGLRAASLEYFSREPENLNLSQQLALLTLLRGPNHYLQRSQSFQERYHVLRKRLLELGALAPKQASRLCRAQVGMSCSNLQVFRSESIPFIAQGVTDKRQTVVSTINHEMQNAIYRLVDGSALPLSAICISNNRIIALAGTYGGSHGLTFRTNVGSTLKPFIYTFLRNSGVEVRDRFPTDNVNKLEWAINEIHRPAQRSLTLGQALTVSNNNVFVNACLKVGLEAVLDFLARITGKTRSSIVPATILGATVDGMTLYELATSYYRYFVHNERDSVKRECLSILHAAATARFGMLSDDVFLKTGTTNGNRERFAIVGNSKLVFGFLREEHVSPAHSKDGGLLGAVGRFLRGLPRRDYTWM